MRNGNKVIFSTTFNAMPGIRFRLTEGKVCFNSNRYQVSHNRLPYKLLNDKYCNSKYRTRNIDPRYKLVGQVREDKLFKDNDIYDDMLALPNYIAEDTEKYYWNLYSNSYYYWSFHCDKSIDTNRHKWYNTVQRILDVHANSNYILDTSVFLAIGV